MGGQRRLLAHVARNNIDVVRAGFQDGRHALERFVAGRVAVGIRHFRGRDSAADDAKNDAIVGTSQDGVRCVANHVEPRV